MKVCRKRQISPNYLCPKNTQTADWQLKFTEKIDLDR